VYLAQGAAIIDFYLRKVRIRPFMRGLILAVILAMPSIVFAIALGIVDIWADFRKARGPVLK
jgi:ABC-type spermidine/putrescine transport system permease subunit II